MNEGMKTTAFIFSLLCFLLYLHNTSRRRGKYVNTDPKQENAPILEKGAPIGENSSSENRLNTLYEMLSIAERQEEAQKERIFRINELNQFGVVVNEKNTKRAYDELYRIQQRKIAIENQIARL